MARKMMARSALRAQSSSEFSLENEEDSDYLLDPDQMHDSLPQPYRMINKIIQQIIESVCNEVEAKDKLLLAESQKMIQAPRLDPDHTLNNFNKATALCPSPDGQFIFVGLPKGLAVFEAVQQQQLHAWEQPRTEITDIKVYPLGGKYHIVLAQDDMAKVRIFLFGYQTLIFVRVVVENLPENFSKSLCLKFEASANGDFVGFVFEETINHEVWMEVHRLPLDSWAKSLDAVQERNKKEEEAADQIVNVNIAASESKPAQRLSDSIESLLANLGAKLQAPSLALSVKAPSRLPLPANPSSGIGSAILKVDSGEILGSGSNHVLSSTCLQSMDAMFGYRHEESMQYLTKEGKDRYVSAFFHFVNSSRLIPSGQGQTGPAAVLVWWSDCTVIHHYSLARSTKSETSSSENVTVEIDPDQKPDIVWPFSDRITCTAVSPCSSYLAVGLRNGNIVLWDWILGLQKAVLSTSQVAPVKSLIFLDPCLFPLETPPAFLSYPTVSATYFLASCSDGSIKMFDTLHGSHQIPRCIVPRNELDDNMETFLHVVPNSPQLMLSILTNGNMYIRDLATGAIICQVALPPPQLVKSWQPILAFGDGGKILFVKGEGTTVDDDDGTVSDISNLFVFHLTSCPTLEGLVTQASDTKDIGGPSLEDRVKAILQWRVQQQTERKPRLQERWGKLRFELEILAQAGKIPLDKCNHSLPLTSDL